MAGTIHKEDSRHPEFRNQQKKQADEAAKKIADEKAVAEKKAADEAAKKK